MICSTENVGKSALVSAWKAWCSFPAEKRRSDDEAKITKIYKKIIAEADPLMQGAPSLLLHPSSASSPPPFRFPPLTALCTVSMIFHVLPFDELPPIVILFPVFHLAKPISLDLTRESEIAHPLVLSGSLIAIACYVFRSAPVSEGEIEIHYSYVGV